MYLIVLLQATAPLESWYLADAFLHTTGFLNVSNSVITGNSAGGGGFIRIIWGSLFLCVAVLVTTIHKIYMLLSSVFLLNNQYNDVTTAVQGPGIVSACYPGACSEFHIGSFGVGCTVRENKLGGNCSSCSPGMYLPARTTYSTCLACLPGKHAPNLGMAECTTCSAGRYQDAMQGDICKTCPNGKYSNNSIACIKVPPGSCATTELCRSIAGETLKA